VYGRFDSNAYHHLLSKQMMREKAAQLDAPGDLPAHTDMDDFVDIPMPFLFAMPLDRRVGSVRAGRCP
jgi:hypothetical protein